MRGWPGNGSGRNAAGAKVRAVRRRSLDHAPAAPPGCAAARVAALPRLRSPRGYIWITLAGFRTLPEPRRGDPSVAPGGAERNPGWGGRCIIRDRVTGQGLSAAARGPTPTGAPLAPAEDPTHALRPGERPPPHPVAGGPHHRP